MLDIQIQIMPKATVVVIVGELDGATAPVAQGRILPLAEPGCRLVLEMTKVAFMSSAGLRMLLSTYRQVSGNGGNVVLVGLSDEMRDTMAMTGFLDFFKTCATLDEGLIVLAG